MSDTVKLREALEAARRLVAIDEGAPGADDEIEYLDAIAVARALLASANEGAALREDAERWRALMASQRIRVMGSAGFHWRKPGEKIGVRPGDYMHIGVEFWNVHEAAHPSAEFPQEHSRELLTFYADRIRAKTNEAPDEGKARAHREPVPKSSPLLGRDEVVEWQRAGTLTPEPGLWCRMYLRAPADAVGYVFERDGFELRLHFPSPLKQEVPDAGVEDNSVLRNEDVASPHGGKTREGRQQ